MAEARPLPFLQKKGGHIMNHKQLALMLGAAAAGWMNDGPRPRRGKTGKVSKKKREFNAKRRKKNKAASKSRRRNRK